MKTVDWILVNQAKIRTRYLLNTSSETHSKQNELAAAVTMT